MDALCAVLKDAKGASWRTEDFISSCIGGISAIAGGICLTSWIGGVGLTSWIGGVILASWIGLVGGIGGIVLVGGIGWVGGIGGIGLVGGIGGIVLVGWIGGIGGIGLVGWIGGIGGIGLVGWIGSIVLVGGIVLDSWISWIALSSWIGCVSWTICVDFYIADIFININPIVLTSDCKIFSTFWKFDWSDWSLRIVVCLEDVESKRGPIFAIDKDDLIHIICFIEITNCDVLSIKRPIYGMDWGLRGSNIRLRNWWIDKMQSDHADTISRNNSQTI